MTLIKSECPLHIPEYLQSQSTCLACDGFLDFKPSVLRLPAPSFPVLNLILNHLRDMETTNQWLLNLNNFI